MIGKDLTGILIRNFDSSKYLDSVLLNSIFQDFVSKEIRYFALPSKNSKPTIVYVIVYDIKVINSGNIEEAGPYIFGTTLDGTDLKMNINNPVRPCTDEFNKIAKWSGLEKTNYVERLYDGNFSFNFIPNFEEKNLITQKLKGYYINSVIPPKDKGHGHISLARAKEILSENNPI